MFENLTLREEEQERERVCVFARTTLAQRLPLQAPHGDFQLAVFKCPCCACAILRPSVPKNNIFLSGVFHHWAIQFLLCTVL